MADVRSMLRAERASRRITHPNASYTSDGKLLCNLCESLVKSEAAWQSHLHSTGHTLRLSRAQEAAAARRSDAPSKKRKASDLASPEVDERKRAKPAAAATEAPQVESENGEDEDGSPDVQMPAEPPVIPTPALPEANGSAQPPAQPTQAEAVDENELAAFERDLADLEASEAAPANAFNSAATISAAPMTAEEIAAQAREEQSAQRGKRDAEIEAEREEAVRLLEDEFEEMEGLEERVKRLRERRERLRDEGCINVMERVATRNAEKDKHAAEDDEDQDDEDDFDEWRFGGS